VGVVEGCPGYWARDSRAVLAIVARAFMSDRSLHTGEEKEWKRGKRKEMGNE
jgi:hypothetical protein